MKKRALCMSLIGLALGAGVGILFHLLSEPEAYLAQPEHRLSLVLYLLASGLYGAVNMGTSALYDMEDWSILRCTATHFAICMVSSALFFGTLILAGWMSMPSLGWWAVMLAAFVAVYFLIWLIQYLAYRRKVKQMNAQLRKWKSSRDN